jgi:hypothetical protein
MSKATIFPLTHALERARRYTLLLLVLLLSLSTASCTPALNWREVRVAGALVLLPCKPDRAERIVRLANMEVAMQMAGCEAAGAIFAMSHVELPLPVEPSAVLHEWRNDALKKMRSSEVRELQSTAPTGPRFLIELDATGRGATGDPLHARLAWLVSGRDVYHLAVYGDPTGGELSDNFFQQVKLD